MAKAATPKKKADAFKWPATPRSILTDYVKERVTDDPDAPVKGLPFLHDGVLRVHASDWIDWLKGLSIEPPKREATQVLKDAGLTQISWAIPGQGGKARGFYTGKLAGTSRLPKWTKPERKVAADV